MAYFAALVFFADSGFPQILTETGVLAAGSLNRFISCRHYIRFKHLHALLVVAIQMLHIKFFLAKHDHLSESFMNSFINYMMSQQQNLLSPKQVIMVQLLNIG